MLDELVIKLDTRQAEHFFEYAGFKARSMRQPLNEAKRALLFHITMTFLSEGEEAHVYWPALNERYERQKFAKWGPQLILHASGELYRAATRSSAAIVTDSELHYEVDVPYAAAHLHGGWMDDKGNMHPPARPWLVETVELVEEVKLAFIDWLESLKSSNARRRGRDITFPQLPELNLPVRA